MAIDEADQSGAGGFSQTDASEADGGRSHEPTRGSDVRVGDYTWADFMDEHGHGDEVSVLYPHGVDGPDDQLGLDAGEEAHSSVPEGDDWDRVQFDPAASLGYHPDELPALIADVFAPNATSLREIFLDYVDPSTTPVVKGVYTWEHYKWEYYYDDDGSRPRDDEGTIDRFDPEEALGFDPDRIERRLHEGGNAAMELDEVIEERTVNVREDFDEDDFFSSPEGHTTVTNRYDLEKTVPLAKKGHFREVERYWVNEPYAFVAVFHSEKENEKKYYLIEPYQNEIETELQEFLAGKLRTAIKYSDEGIKHRAGEAGRRDVIEEETRRLLKRYDLFEAGGENAGLIETIRSLLDDEAGGDEETEGQLDGIEARPEPVLLEEDSDTLSEYQVEKLLYLLKRNFIGYERIDGIKHDINVEDISCDGYNSPVFVYHSEYEQIITNIYHGEEELDDFVVKLAQRSGKGISKRMPQVDATLPDGSRAQLTLGREVSDHGTNYTIRQFKDVPFTPIDLVNWNTFSLDEMAFLWLCIENHKSLIFAGGTASGKTTSLNAVSLFIPSNSKIVSIEDTREVELPQRNWIASVTRPSFSDDAQGDIDEFQLLEAALRQRPDYIVMGEVRGEEGRDLFQVMSTGHTSYSTFHADSVDEVLKRFTTDPINVSKTMFTALDLVSIQTQTRVQGSKVRRNKSLTEINHYEAENDEINVQDVYQWQAETDEFLKMGDSNTLDEIKFDRGWNHEKLEQELFKRRVILAYLIKNELDTYAEVAATVQAFINDPETILTLIANGQLEDSLDDLREMESVLIDVDQEKEELVPRPDPSTETYNLSTDILERAEESLFDEYRGEVPSGLASALGDVEASESIEVDRPDVDEFDFGGEVDDGVAADEWNLGDGDTEFTFDSDEDVGDDAPSWLDDDEFGFGGAEAAEAGEAGPGADTETGAGASTEPTPPDRPQLEGETGSADDTTDAAGSGTSPDPVDAPQLEGETAPPANAEPEADPPELDSGGESTGDHGIDVEDEATPSSAADGDTARGRSPTDEDGATSPADASDGDSDGATGSSADDGIEGLFDDMGHTIEELDGATDDTTAASDEAGSETGSAPDPEIDTSDFDSMFPDRTLETIFGDGEDDRTLGADRNPSDDPGVGPRNGPDEEASESIDNRPTSGSAGDVDDDSEEGSIFGSGSGSIFDDDGTDGGDDSGPTFDADDATDGSIFGDGTDGGSPFDDDDSDDEADDESIFGDGADDEEADDA